jgi:hypothetical protein
MSHLVRFLLIIRRKEVKMQKNYDSAECVIKKYNPFYKIHFSWYFSNFYLIQYKSVHIFTFLNFCRKKKYVFTYKIKSMTKVLTIYNIECYNSEYYSQIFICLIIQLQLRFHSFLFVCVACYWRNKLYLLADSFFL